MIKRFYVAINLAVILSAIFIAPELNRINPILFQSTAIYAAQPIRIDYVTDSANAATTTLDFTNLTTNVGTNTLIICFATLDENNSAITPVATFNTTETFDNTGLAISKSGTTGRTTFWFRLTNPSAQADAIVTIASMSASIGESGACASYRNVHQTDLEDTPIPDDSSGSTDCTSTNVTTDSNDLVIGFVGVDGDRSATLAPSATGQTGVAAPAFVQGLTIQLTEDADGTSGAPQGWTWTTSVSNGCIVFNLNGTAVGGAVSQIQNLNLLGVTN